MSVIEWRDHEQVSLLEKMSEQSNFNIPDEPNGMFSRLDSWVLQGILRYFIPKRMIEIGCGYSSLISARVNHDYMLNTMDLTCVDPHMPEFIRGKRGITRFVDSYAEELKLRTFTDLGKNDVLFIDSSHIVETGGDVVYLVNKILPCLAPGVLVHFHDIFLPWDYPQVFLDQDRRYTEQYLVEAFLSFNSVFEVLFGSCWMIEHNSDVLEVTVPGYPEKCGEGGASLWIRRVT